MTNEQSAWIEYDAAADQLAFMGLTGAIGDPLPANMTPDAVALINDDPEAFQHRVSGFAYARAMMRIHEKYGDPQDKERA